MALYVGPYPAFDCSPLLSCRCIVLGLRSASSGAAFVGVQAPSVWKFVFSDEQYHHGMEKAYNRNYCRKRNVMGTDLGPVPAATFRDLGGVPRLLP